MDDSESEKEQTKDDSGDEPLGSEDDLEDEPDASVFDTGSSVMLALDQCSDCSMRFVDLCECENGIDSH